MTHAADRDVLSVLMRCLLRFYGQDYDFCNVEGVGQREYNEEWLIHRQAITDSGEVRTRGPGAPRVL